METFAVARKFVNNPLFDVQRQIALEDLSLLCIDDPIREVVDAPGSLI